MPTLRLAFQFPAAERGMIEHWSIVFGQIEEADEKKQ
jgi:hypothetical protein